MSCFPARALLIKELSDELPRRVDRAPSSRAVQKVAGVAVFLRVQHVVANSRCLFSINAAGM